MVFYLIVYNELTPILFKTYLNLELYQLLYTQQYISTYTLHVYVHTCITTPGSPHNAMYSPSNIMKLKVHMYLLQLHTYVDFPMM